MERYKIFLRILIIACSIAAAHTHIAYAKIFHSNLFQYKHEIIEDGTGPSVSSSIQSIGLIQVTYDIASRAFGDDLRIVDNTNSSVPFTITEHKDAHEWQGIPIIERYRTNDKDIVVLDVGEKVSHATFKIDFNQDSGEGGISVFSSPVYYGIEITPWDVLGRNISVYKNMSTGRGMFTNNTIEYTLSNNEYVMIVLKHNIDKPFTLAQIYKKNKNFEDSRESFYVESEIKEKDAKTIITIDTKNSIIGHNRLNLTMHSESLMVDATVETSKDNNQWVFRGTDSLYRFSEGNKEIHKTSLTYEKNNDRFIRITIPQQNILVHRLVLISGPSQYISFVYDSSMRYKIYYGNAFAKPFSLSIITPPPDLFADGRELKIGVREDNPEYISNISYKTNSDGFITAMGRTYAEPILIGIISLFILLGVIKIIRLETK